MVSILERFQATRAFSEQLCQPLAVEDFVVQSMPDASPTRWHLAHTTWFFETFLLARWEPGYHSFNEHYHVLFNSYYNRLGEQFPRPRRGLLTRPTVAEVFDYRHSIDQRVTRLLTELGEDQAADVLPIVELGINHEQQHQELMLTDLKHLFSCNPLWPAYQQQAEPLLEAETASGWLAFKGGLVSIGHSGSGFAYDNEGPRHTVFLRPFELQSRLVTAGEYREFINDGGYRRPELWLSLGWSTVCDQSWSAPLYWVPSDGEWQHFTLHGLRPLDPQAPVCHISFFEADAFARWSSARLPTEAEWEHAATSEGEQRQQLSQLDGVAWQWTSSPYTPYPGYAASPDALGEYNGKFMCNQYVLRGSSCATPAGHTRPTYRNFFPPDARWQFTGIRLARDVH